ncbi:Plasmodium exported protein, unknown function [Plasmodium knowlesi strain H]|uniref:Tryptophan/threonine-rich plasmodium antigen C-terminal domain-containing protein n=3 Tax=Plasmodium knowlesi TaxID=5850 RepID=A0A5K1U5D9_PLAKH|nr:tryptophan-rich antigen [Plasmodium knowlesi strain H]OTN67598.1 putative Blood-stage membrane protein [Plasmodium knowlesi]CAA9990590.1 tryptophan-rich antigen [Plasmodium knowlesi strain H]SBO19867.1 Plasmodium exported protein, unknown function [Plasmodium knowlesi strain H]SBO22289.1 Plasmodium exported protein, unknown function [Plasmodium knowlesi strain H]VVS80064.1 tryptophan-rich antigen [Plasmodium knowlesi strain H]|eukprot:XP_002260974.1 Blood-stage membrane protein, putative [Plasmodium knowlesi strain H]
MAHTNEIIVNGASERSMQSQCGNYQIVGARQERKMDEQKSTQRSSFFTKKTAMLFFVLAYIFLKHQDDAPRQGVNASLPLCKGVGRILASKERATPSGGKFQLGRGAYDNGVEIHRYIQHYYEDPEEDYENPEEDYDDPYEVYDDLYEAYDDPYGNYADPYGNDADPYGNYADPYGNYADPYGNYADPYGNYADPYGNYADPYGNYEDDEEPYSDEEIEGEDEGSEEETEGDSSEEEYDAMDVSKYEDWNTFKQSLEADWGKFEMKLFKAKETWMEQKNKELSKWLSLVQNRWNKYCEIPTTGEDPGNLRKQDWSSCEWIKWFNAKVKCPIHAQLEKWLDENHSNLFNILVKHMAQFKCKKIKGWLMYHWKMNEEDDDYETYAVMPTLKFLDLVQSRKWYHANPNIDKQRKELMEWFLLKEKEYVKKEQVDLSHWENIKHSSINSMITTFSEKRLTEKEWNKFLSEIKF